MLDTALVVETVSTTAVENALLCPALGSCWQGFRDRCSWVRFWQETMEKQIDLTQVTGVLGSSSWRRLPVRLAFFQQKRG